MISCSGSKVSSVTGSLPRNVKIALAPSGGVLADAIGVELFNRGFTVFDTNQMSNLLVRLNMTEIELADPKNLSVLKGQGIDAILNVKATVAYDGKPQSASVRVNSTSTGEILAGLSWQNGWGGQAGSIADRSMRKDIAEAAKEIIDNLLRGN
jgi:hypothetical protein